MSNTFISLTWLAMEAAFLLHRAGMYRPVYVWDDSTPEPYDYATASAGKSLQCHSAWDSPLRLKLRLPDFYLLAPDEAVARLWSVITVAAEPMAWDVLLGKVPADA